MSNLLFWFFIILNFSRVLLISIVELSLVVLLLLIGKITGKYVYFKYAKNKALAIDQWVNSELLGHPDETISSRLGRSIGRERYWWVKLLRLFVDYVSAALFNDIDHCANSIMPLEQQNFENIDYEIWSWQKD